MSSVAAYPYERDSEGAVVNSYQNQNLDSTERDRLLSTGRSKETELRVQYDENQAKKLIMSEERVAELDMSSI